MQIRGAVDVKQISAQTTPELGITTVGISIRSGVQAWRNKHRRRCVQKMLGRLPSLHGGMWVCIPWKGKVWLGANPASQEHRSLSKLFIDVSKQLFLVVCHFISPCAHTSVPMCIILIGQWLSGDLRYISRELGRVGTSVG